MTRYASSTTVSSSQSRAEIEKTLERYGATGFMYGWQGDHAIVGFTMRGRNLKFVLPMPARDDRDFTHHTKGVRTAEQAQKLWEQAGRQRWRALALLIKAKLEAIESGITVFDEEFLAHIMLPGGETFGQRFVPQVNAALEGRTLPLLIGGPA